MKENNTSKIITRTPEGRIRVRTENNLPSRTQQQFKDECDVNNIIKRYKNTGQITHLAKNPGVFADLSDVPTYETALQKVIDANNAFGSLSSDLRSRFQNDPGKLLAFLSDPKNYDEGVKLGLLVRKESSPEPETPQPKTKTKTKNETQTPLPTGDGSQDS